MERLSLALLLAAGLLAGCLGGDATATKDEEEMFKNPKPVERDKVPANVFEHKGPAFIGEPTGATKPSGDKPPAGR